MKMGNWVLGLAVPLGGLRLDRWLCEQGYLTTAIGLWRTDAPGHYQMQAINEKCQERGYNVQGERDLSMLRCMMALIKEFWHELKILLNGEVEFGRESLFDIE
jgi:hypothetical protein